MPTLVLDPPPADFQALLERRRRIGADRRDEVWKGVLHMTPTPSAHARLAAQVLILLAPSAAACPESAYQMIVSVIVRNWNGTVHPWPTRYGQRTRSRWVAWAGGAGSGGGPRCSVSPPALVFVFESAPGGRLLRCALPLMACGVERCRGWRPARSCSSRAYSYRSASSAACARPCSSSAAWRPSRCAPRSRLSSVRSVRACCSTRSAR